ncbi:MAG TPA: hypothetical protein VII16_14965, partial [Actinomycetes bacterium]
MPERLTDDQLERELVELGKRLDIPAPPQMAAAVQQRIASQIEAGGTPPIPSGRPGPGQPRAWWRNPRFLQAAAAVLLVFAALLASSPQVRAAVRDVLRFAGIEIHEESAPVRPTPTGHPALPGERIVTLAEAQAQADFAIPVPADLGAPDEVRVADGEPPRVVSLIYRAGPGRPAADSSGIAIRIDEFAGSVSPVYGKYGAEVERTPIDGSLGIWVPRPHTLLYIDRSGSFREEAARMSAQTLIWQVGVTTLRMEGDFTKDEAIG